MNEPIPFAEPQRTISGGIVLLIILFWIAQYAVLTAQRLLMGSDNEWSFLLPRFCVTLVGVCVSLAMVAAHKRLGGWRVRSRIFAALGIAVFACVIHSAFNFLIFDLFMRAENRASADVATYLMALLQWFWSYAALSGIMLALFYSFELGEREIRIMQLQRIAHSAQLRALRYQLNPHFMFNTLNSIAALVSRRDVETAERMVENLADFLRAGLSLDPQEEIPVEREIGLQSLYLDIEMLRFGDRLRVDIDLDSGARLALLPSLITQPLIENAIRHAVSPSEEAVTLRISARRNGEQLEIGIENDMPERCGAKRPGTGVGLANVAERLTTIYGDAATFSAGPRGDGTFTVCFTIPFRSG